MNNNLRKVLVGFLFVMLIFFIVPWLRFAGFIMGYDSLFAKQDIRISPLYLGYIITLISVSIACLLGIGKPKKYKFRIWGSFIMIPIALPLAYSMGITYAIIEGSPWATMVMFVIFPVLFLLGLVLLLVGIFKKSGV